MVTYLLYIKKCIVYYKKAINGYVMLEIFRKFGLFGLLFENCAECAPQANFFKNISRKAKCGDIRSFLSN